MKLLRLLVAVIAGLAIFFATEASAANTTLPVSIFAAHTVYVDNQSGFGELSYVAELELSRWGRFDTVEATSKADLVIVLTGSSHVRLVPVSEGVPSYDPKRTSTRTTDTPEEAPAGFTRVTLLDAKAGKVLWSGLVKTDGPRVKGRLLDGFREAFDQAEKARYKR